MKSRVIKGNASETLPKGEGNTPGRRQVEGARTRSMVQANVTMLRPMRRKAYRLIVLPGICGLIQLRSYIRDRYVGRLFILPGAGWDIGAVDDRLCDLDFDWGLEFCLGAELRGN